MLPTLAAGIGGMTIAHWAIVLIVIVAVIAILVIFVKQTGIQIPAFIINVFWVLLAAFICIAAIKLLMEM